MDGHKPTLLESLEAAAKYAARVAFSHYAMRQAGHAAYWQGRAEAYQDVVYRVLNDSVLRDGNCILILRDWRNQWAGIGYHATDFGNGSYGSSVLRSWD